MNRHMHPHYWHDSSRMININRWSAEHDTDVFIKYLESVKGEDRPVLAFLSWNPPHPPYTDIDDRRKALYTEDYAFRPNVPEEWRCDRDYLEKRHDYFAAVAGLDEQFARLVTYLKDSGMYDNSIIVLSGDHGDMMGSQGLYGKNVWYEESLRIPLVIHDPDLGSGCSSSIIMSEDQMPTLLDLMGVKIPSTVNGISHASSLLSQQNGREYSYHMMIPGMPEQVMPYRERGLDNRCFGWRCIRTGSQKYVIDSGTVPGFEVKRYLYDLEKDPYEMNPLELSSSDEQAQRFDSLIKENKSIHNDIFLI